MVKYPEQFVGNNRIVELTGEGCFKVTHNPEKPFIVKWKYVDNRARYYFNVKSHPYDQTDLVEVKEGKVQVDLPEAMMRISSGEHVIINKISDSYSKEKILWKICYLAYRRNPIQLYPYSRCG